MKLICLTLVFCLLAPSAAAAQDAEQVCLPVEAHRLVLADLKELPPLRERVTLLDQKLSIQAENITDLKTARDFAVQAKEESQKAHAAQVKLTREAREEQDAWYRSAFFQIPLGMGIMAVAVWAAGQLR